MNDSLAIAANNFKPPQNPLLKYEIEVRYRPSVPNNVKHCQVFEDDEKIKCFMEFIGEFSNSVIVQQEKEQPTTWEENITGHIVLQLKGNAIPRGIVPLEKIFKSNDMASKPTE